MGEMKKFCDIEQARFEDIDLGSGKVRGNNVAGFRVGDVISITEKVDGANASVRLVDGEIKAYSRRQELSFTNTLSGFYNYAMTLKKDMFYDGAIVIFGEWMGNSDRMNKIVYNKTKGKWIVYSIWDCVDEQWWDAKDVKSFCTEWGLEYVKEYYYGLFKSWDDVRQYAHMNSYGDTQEGLVVRNESQKERLESGEARQMGLHNMPYILKLVNDDFRESMVKVCKVVDPAAVALYNESVEKMKMVVTENRMEKIMGKGLLDGEISAEDDPKEIGNIIRYMSKAVWDDIIKEEKEVVESVGENASKISAKIVSAWVRKKILGIGVEV